MSQCLDLLLHLCVPFNAIFLYTSNTINSTFCKSASILLAPICSLHHSQSINDINSSTGMVSVWLTFSTLSPHKFPMFVFHRDPSDFAVAVVVSMLALYQCPDISNVPSEQQAIVFPSKFSSNSLSWVLLIFSLSAEVKIF